MTTSMTAAVKWNLISVEDYLASESAAPIKHEYLRGVVHAMAGARIGHNNIAGNTFAALHGRLRKQRCRPYNSDTKIRVQRDDGICFYYPDVSVVCRSNPPTDSFQDEPVILIEVLSKQTRRIDLGEKKDAYLAIPSLAVYVLIEQEAPLVVAFRRSDAGFVREVHEGLDAVLALPEIGVTVPLAEIFEGVSFAPEANTAEDD